MKQERNLFQCGQHQEDSRLASQSAKNTPRFIKGEHEAKMGGYMQMGSESQIDHCLGVNPEQAES